MVVVVCGGGGGGVCVCVCVCEREREREYARARERVYICVCVRERERERERESTRACVCVCVCVCVYIILYWLGKIVSRYCVLKRESDGCLKPCPSPNPVAMSSPPSTWQRASGGSVSQQWSLPYCVSFSSHVHMSILHPEYRLVGLVVKASASRAGGPGFESR